MKAFPGAAVKVVIDENNYLLGIYFQDERMKIMFNLYPDLVIFDATYTLNNRKMPLFVLLVIDGDGNSEIAALFFIKSESREATGPILDYFKETNKNWDKTKIFLGDKDWADRSIFQEKFPNAALQICMFHVMRIFNREIGTQKHGITKI